MTVAKKPDPGVVQRKASDPTASVWVTASAGTGKTQVLTDRTLRLMLSGAKPGEILAITFTRAAASVMTNRIRDELASWATCDDKTLNDKLKRLTGRAPDAKTAARARSLFAEFLDAHGDMRIQTIHSFAQSLLRRFPIESGVPPYFDVMDDQTVAEMLRESQAEVLQQAGRSPRSPLAKAVGIVAPEVNEDDFIGLIGELAERRGQLTSIFRENGGLDGTVDAVYKYLGAQKGLTAADLTEQLNAYTGYAGNAPDIQGLADAARLLNLGTAADREKAALIKTWVENPEQRVALFADYTKIFLTQEGEIRKKLTTKDSADAEDILRAEAARLQDGLEALRTLNVAQNTESFLRMSDAILQNYAKKKRALNLLDFDDLVYQAGEMMKKDDHAASWALEKLPGDLKHILIDEGQDTNPDQWNLVTSIVQEFFNGPSRKKSKDNTIFVVGDEKQSIFSFQRANPEEFAGHKKMFSDLVTKAGGKWREVTMEIAFRSSPAITQAVDAVFANPAAADGLFHEGDGEEHKVTHDPFRRGQAGIVEVYPIDKAPPAPESKPWELPLKMEGANDPSVELANKIADQVKGWFDSGEKLESRDRPINPADIMILVRRRSAFVDHMVRALKKRNIPVAGADRMSLREQIAVMDLVALGETLLFPKDEYKLACVLKSPLIGMSDQQLEDLALGRKTDLWETLKAKAADPAADKVYKAAYDYLAELQTRVGAERPYEFYSSVLMSPCPATGKSGLTSFYTRLGYEAEDPLVEFLNAIEQFEQIHTPDLQGFISWLEAGESEVKREISLNPEQPRVHIMTVHGAKGLEAPIVILPDTVGTPADNPRARPHFLWPTKDRAVPLWAPRSDMENKTFTDERQKVELERDREFRRLMYVAMTRAGDRLYVYGDHVPKNRFEESWYSLIRTGLEADTKNGIERVPVTPVTDAPAEGEAPAETPEDVPTILRLAVPQTAKPVPDHVKPLEKGRVVGIPVWARTTPAEGAGAMPRFRPSQLNKESNDNKDTAKGPYVAPSPLADRKDDEYYMNLGTAVHALLEFLPHIPEAEQDAAAKDFLADPGFAIRDADREKALHDVKAVLADPQFGALFSPTSRPEVSISGYIEHNGRKELFNAAIDRLVVKDDEVLIVDYKNGRKVPENAAQVPADYMVQLAAYRVAVEQIYPGKTVKCALLYTQAAKLIELPTDKMDAAMERLKVSKYIAPPAKKPGSGPRAA